MFNDKKHKIMKTKVNEIPLVGPRGRSELIKKINETNENVDNRFKTLEEVLGIDLNPNLDKKYYQYFTIEAKYDGTRVNFRQSSYAADAGLDPLKVEISTDNGGTWTEITAPGQAAVLDEGDKLLIRGKNEVYGYYDTNLDDYCENCNFWADSPCYVYGNIMSLVGGDDFARLRKVKECAFVSFFLDYDGQLEPWILSKEDEELLLPATTLANSCYYYMFTGCTNLTTAPELPATTLASNCYVSMFNGCSNLSYIKAMFTTTPGDSYMSNWVENVKATGTFVKNSAATWDVTGNNGVPSGWTVETADA